MYIRNSENYLACSKDSINGNTFIIVPFPLPDATLTLARITTNTNTVEYGRLSAGSTFYTQQKVTGES